MGAHRAFGSEDELCQRFIRSAEKRSAPEVAVRAPLFLVTSGYNMRRLRARPERLGLAASLMIAFALDFPWHGLVGHTHWAKVAWIPFVSPPVRIKDIGLNLLLFFPAGVFAAWRAGSRRSAAINSAAASFPVAFLGEATQLYSHGRFPSATDLVCNVFGAIAGGLLIQVVNQERTARPR